MCDLHEKLLSIMKTLPTDYTPWGQVERWKNDNESYPDCSSGCKHYFVLEGKLGMDWGVCTSKNSPRAGLLTFEHQSGYKCFEEDGEGEVNKQV